MQKDTPANYGKLIAPFSGTVASPREYFLIVEPGARAKPAVRALERLAAGPGARQE